MTVLPKFIHEFNTGAKVRIQSQEAGRADTQTPRWTFTSESKVQIPLTAAAMLFSPIVKLHFEPTFR